MPTHLVSDFGRSGSLQEVNPNSREWQAYLGLTYAEIRALTAARGTAAPAGLAAPTSASTKAQIVAWLMARGVSLSEEALMSLTKDELLDLVDDILSPAG